MSNTLQIATFCSDMAMVNYGTSIFVAPKTRKYRSTVRASSLQSAFANLMINQQLNVSCKYFNRIHIIVDPFVDMIGSIEHDARTGHFITSGYTE
jgi:hypothetical protein